MVYRDAVAVINDRSHSAEQLGSRLEFETLLSNTSASLFAAPLEQIDRVVERSLDRVRTFFQADRCGLLSVSADQQVVKVHLASYGEGVPRVSPDADLAQMFPWCHRRLVVEHQPVRISSVAELPPEAVGDRESLMRLPIWSALMLPVEPSGVVTHMIVLDTVREERAWPDAFVTRLRVFGEMLVGALQRQEMFVELREAEERVSLAADSAEAGLWVFDYGKQLFWATPRARAIFGISPDGAVTLDRVLAACHPGDRDLIRATIAGSFENGAPVRLEHRLLPGKGSARWVLSRGRPYFTPAGEPDRLMGVTIDVSERKQVEDELHGLSRRLIRAQEEERALLARELHDDVSQRLAVLAIDLGRAELAASGAQAEVMHEVRESVIRLSEDVHSLAYQLHPSALEELGLAEALRAECERRARQGQLDLSFDLDPVLAAVSDDARLCLFRVAQEALNNVARHAKATAASVKLRRMDGGLLLAISDDGVGFVPGNPGKPRRLGLASMRERVRLANGTLDIESARGRGTSVVAWVPGEGGR